MKIPVEENVEDNFVKDDEGKLENFTVRLKDTKKLFRCSCGCNVFHKRIGEENTFICNSCNIEYLAEQ